MCSRDFIVSRPCEYATSPANNLDIILPADKGGRQLVVHPKLISILPIESNRTRCDDQIDGKREAVVEVEIICADWNTEDRHLDVNREQAGVDPSADLFMNKLAGDEESGPEQGISLQ